MTRMKLWKNSNLSQAMTSLSMAMLLPCGALAADDLVIDTFDTSANWTKWWGAATQTYEWDGTVDVAGSATSGSVKATVEFNLAANGGDNQFAVYGIFPTTDGSLYASLEFDILFDPASPKRPWGDFGGLEIGFKNSDWSQNWLGSLGVPESATNWLHISMPINATAPKIESVNGIVLKMWSGANDWGQTGTTKFWVDNIRLIARPDVNTPPPTMKLEKVKPGLRLFASAAGAQYQRQNVRTVNTSYSWVGASGPVTYKIGIGEFPNDATGFQAHMFLVPGSGIPTFETSPDWNQPHVVFIQFGGNADGSGYAAFRHKINQPNGNSQIFASSLGSVGSATMVGDWSVTFNPDGSVIMTSPDGTTSTFAFPAEAAALFTGSCYAYFGVQPNEIANIGRSATFSKLQISGVEPAIDESFANGTIDPATLEVIAEDRAGLVPVASDAVLWMSWTLPDKDFVIQYHEELSGDPGDPFWVNLDLPNRVQIGGNRALVIRQGDLDALSNFSGNFFFRLKK